VLVSSLAAAGPSTADAPRPEDAPAQPITRYGRSKRRGEIEALGRGDVPVTIVRPPAIYGPRDVEILEAFRLARRLRFFAVIGAGETRVSMIYGPDCARAVATLALDLSDRSGAVYHVDDGGRWSWHELGAAIGAAVGVEIREAKLPDWAFRLAASVSEGWGALRGTAVVFDREKVLEMKRSFLGGHARIRADYGWTPEVSIPEGARRTAAWYREQGWL
jgi:nucleoside-diphosphate-sugar epimerase